MTNDCWAPSPPKAASSLSQVQIAQMQHTIEQNLRETLKHSEDATMEGSNDHRVTVLEDQVKQLTASVGQLTGKSIR